MSAKRVKSEVRIPVSELQPGGAISSLLHVSNGAEAVAGFLMLLGMEGISADMKISANGVELPIGRQSLENLFDCWMPNVNAPAAVAELFSAGIVTIAEGKISVPLYERYVRTESESASRMRTMRAQRKDRDIQSVEKNECAQCDAIEAHNVTGNASQCDTLSERKESFIKEKNNARKFKEREEMGSPSLPFASSCSEESPAGWRKEAGCGTAADAEPESSGGLNAEQMSRAKPLASAGNSTDMLSYDTGGNTERIGGRLHRLDPREVARTWSLSSDAKLLVEKFATTCPSLQLKNSASPESLNMLVAEALRSRPLNDILRVFELAEKSDFLTGRNGKMRNAPVTLDWILQPANFERILRGELGDYGKNTRQMNIRRDEFAIQFFN